MQLELVPVPSRVFKQVSTWILLFTGVLDLTHVLLAGLADLHYLTTQQLALANLVLAFVAGVSRFVQQNIALTEEQKAAMIERVQAAPVKGAAAPPESPQ